jgi:hypothetical protein
MNINKLEDIHNNLINGNFTDMVKQIKAYGNYEFWQDYREYLNNQYDDAIIKYGYFTDATIIYSHKTNR